MPETTEKTWNVTAYRDGRGRLWQLRSHGRWYSPDPVSRDDMISGFADARFDSLEDLDAARGPLTAVNVDNVAALLATKLSTVRPDPGHIASIAEALMIATSNLSADVETRARAIAEPRIAEVERDYTERRLAVERDRDFQIQRKDDVIADLGRILKSYEQQRDRLYAQVTRVDTFWRSLPINGEFEQQLREALHPVEAETAS